MDEEQALTTTEETKSDLTTPKGKGVFRNEFDIGSMLNTAGNVKLNPAQKKVLYAAIDEKDVEIRPDGIIYLPWVHYVKRLHDAFGMEWALIPQGNPTIKDNHVIWGFHLIVKSSLMGYAIGEQQYFPNNNRMTYTDACEGAKSNALMRLCKEIGIGIELWNPRFINNWKSKCAERKGSTWFKKGSAQGQTQLNPPNAKAREEAERFRNDILEEMGRIMESEVFSEIDTEKAHYEVKNAQTIEELVKIKNSWKQEKEIRISRKFETEVSDEEMTQPSLTEEVEENVTEG